MKCPRCKKANSFKIENYEGVEIDRCKTCGGVWLDEGELVKIVRTKQEAFSEETIKQTIAHSFNGIPQSEVESEELCPKCEIFLQPVNYDYKSGIVIDTCPNNHGVWLDKSELEKVQIHKEKWDKDHEQNKSAWVGLAEEAERQELAAKKKDIKFDPIRPIKYLVDLVLDKLD